MFSQIIYFPVLEESRCAIPEGPVNLILPNRFYRLKWVSPPKVLIQGSSFGAAHVAALWAKALVEIPAASKIELFRQVSEELQLNQIEPQKFYGFSWQKGHSFVRKIHRAIVFPWNKEIHSLTRFQEILPFEIQGFYDLKYNFCLGKSIAELLNVEASLGIIENYEDIDWSGNKWNCDFRYKTVVVKGQQKASKGECFGWCNISAPKPAICLLTAKQCRIFLIF